MESVKRVWTILHYRQYKLAKVEPSRYEEYFDNYEEAKRNFDTQLKWLLKSIKFDKKEIENEKAYLSNHSDIYAFNLFRKELLNYGNVK